LVKYLNIFDSNASELHVKLKGVANLLADVIKNGDLYLEHFKTLVLKHKNKASSVPTIVDPEIDELDRYQEQVRLKHGLKPLIKVKPIPSYPEPVEIKQWLKTFQDVQHAYSEVQMYGDLIKRKRELELKAISLPKEEAELMMRYQVTWEKRLSSAIGEFLQLVKMEK
jgi:hypothetical protein